MSRLSSPLACEMSAFFALSYEAKYSAVNGMFISSCAHVPRSASVNSTASKTKELGEDQVHPCNAQAHRHYVRQDQRDS